MQRAERAEDALAKAREALRAVIADAEDSDAIANAIRALADTAEPKGKQE